MVKELKVPEGRQGQEIFDEARRYKFPPGEWVKVDDETYENHKDRDVFEARGGDEQEAEAFECEECGKEFDTERGLSIHKSNHEDDE